jgi:aspartate aminotransferase-like enzyme
VCVDAISSLGSVPLDLADVHLASGVSGKGLGAFPGLAIVFYNHDIAPAFVRASGSRIGDPAEDRLSIRHGVIRRIALVLG